MDVRSENYKALLPLLDGPEYCLSCVDCARYLALAPPCATNLGFTNRLPTAVAQL